MRVQSPAMSSPRDAFPTVSAKLLLSVLLFVVFVASGKKAKKCSAGPEDGSEDIDAEVFCKKLTRLIRMEKADEIVVVDSRVNSSALLQCKYCEERDNGLPKIWSRQKHIFTGNITEEGHLGLYFCKAPYVDTPDKSFNYLIDFIAKGADEVQGTLNDLRNFTRNHLGRVNSRLFNLTFPLRSATVKMKVYTDWSDWSLCDCSFRKMCLRQRLGRCRVKPICQDLKECSEDRLKLKGFVFNERQNTERPPGIEGEVIDPKIVENNLMGFGIALSCRSLLLMKLIPDLYSMVSVIPDFLLMEKCTGRCQSKSPKKDPRYKKSIILAKGAHLTLVCPDSTIDSQIVWEHNKLRLPPNRGMDYISDSNEPRQYVDSFNTLYLFEVTDKESGNYTCFVDGVRMQEVQIIVLTRSLFFTKEFTRHLKYLGLMFFVCFLGFLAGVIVMCVKSHSERVKSRTVRKKRKKEKVAEGSEKLLCQEESDSDPA